MSQNKKEKSKKILALDYGQKRVGLAMGDTSHGISFPKGVIENASLSKTCEAINTIVEQNNIQLIVLGLPKSLGGGKSEQENQTMLFYETLKKHLSIPLELFDERFTTKIATINLHTLNKSERQQRGMKDALSAQLILEGYFKSKVYKDEERISRKN